MKYVIKKQIEYCLVMFPFVVIAGCGYDNQVKQTHQISEVDIPNLYVSFNQAEIIICHGSDSISFEHWETKDSTVNELRTYHIPINKRTELVKLSEWEKDSIYRWVRKLVVYPVSPKRFCTDYVGYVSLAIVYSSQVQQSCTYASICDWNTLSPETQKLNALFKSKFKNF